MKSTLSTRINTCVSLLPVRRFTCPSGVTLIEVAVSIAVIMTGLLAYTSVVHSYRILDEINTQSALAREALNEKILELQDFQDNGQYANVFALYNADPADDPNGHDTGPGNSFPVTVLAPFLSGKAPLAWIRFPTLPGNGTDELREDVINSDWGMPMDLNFDGYVDKLDHASNYRLLPLTIRVDWEGPAGPLFLEAKTLLVKRKVGL